MKLLMATSIVAEKMRWKDPDGNIPIVPTQRTLLDGTLVSFAANAAFSILHISKEPISPERKIRRHRNAIWRVENGYYVKTMNGFSCVR